MQASGRSVSAGREGGLAGCLPVPVRLLTPPLRPCPPPPWEGAGLSRGWAGLVRGKGEALCSGAGPQGRGSSRCRSGLLEAGALGGLLPAASLISSRRARGRRVRRIPRYGEPQPGGGGGMAWGRVSSCAFSWPATGLWGAFPSPVRSSKHSPSRLTPLSRTPGASLRPQLPQES